MKGKSGHTRYIIEMKNISKSYGNIRALKNVDFRLGHNEVVGLVGDNGAGKTTLIKILTGVIRADEGEIYFKGKKVKISSPADTLKLGIEPVHQLGALIEDMDITENFFLGREVVKHAVIGWLDKRIGWLDKREMDKICRTTLENLGIKVDDIHRPISTLSGGEKQAVAMGKCIHFGGEVLVLDEPTASLSLKETAKVLKYIRNAKEMGRAIILISHLTRHVYPVADRFVILERGKKIADIEKSKISQRELETAIVSGRLRK